MAVFDFRDYRSPSEARALEAQAFAERQINNAIASQRANALAMSQAAAMDRDYKLRQQDQQSLQDYRNDTLAFQRSASDRDYGLRQQGQQSLQDYRDNTLAFQESASKQAAQDRAREYELERERFELTKQLNEDRKALAEQQSSIQMAQLAAQKKNLDDLYNRLEAQKNELMKSDVSGLLWGESGKKVKSRDTAIQLIQEQQDALIRDAYIPLKLTPGSPVQSQSLGNMIQSGMQSLGSGSGILSLLSRMGQMGQDPSMDQNQESVASDTGNTLSGSDPYVYVPKPNTSSRARNNAGKASEPKPKRDYSGYSGAVNWATVPPEDESTIKQTLQSMSDYFESQGLSPEEAAAQAYSEAKQETPLFRQFRSK